jgi:hypothetical protein
MTRRASLAMFFIPAALIAPLFALGGILDWPDEAFFWAALGASAIGMSIALELFYEEPTGLETETTTAPTDQALAELTARIEALEERLREDLDARRGQRAERTAPRPSGS